MSQAPLNPANEQSDASQHLRFEQIREIYARLHTPPIGGHGYPETDPQTRCGDGATFDPSEVDGALGPVRSFSIYEPDSKQRISELTRSDGNHALKSFAVMRDLASNHGTRTGFPTWMEGRPDLVRGERLLELCHQMMNDRSITVPSVATDAQLRTNRCIVYETQPWKYPGYAYHFEDTTDPFYLLIRGFDECLSIGVFYPRSSLGISFIVDERVIAQQEFESFRVQLINRSEDAMEVLFKRPGTRAPSLLIQSSHFAHSLWNESAALDALIANVDANTRIHIRSLEPNGDLESVFRPIHLARISRHETSDFATYYSKISRSDELPIPIGRMAIPRSCVQRFVSAAEAENPDDLALARRIRESHRLVFWISIRTKGRILENQAEILSESIDAVASDFGSVAIVIDGFTSAHGTSAPREIVEAERQLIRDIRTRVKSECTFVSLSGAKLTQAYVWGGIADIYLVHHGTLQHKIAWFHDVPGVVHGPAVPDFDITSIPALSCREGALQPIHVLGMTVASATSATADARPDMFNYRLTSSAVVREIRRSIPGTVRDRPVVLSNQKIEPFYDLGDGFFAKVRVTDLISRGGRAWGEGRLQDALDHYVSAAQAMPKWRWPFEKLASFVMSTYSASFAGVDRKKAALAGLIFVLLSGTSSAWHEKRIAKLLMELEAEGEVDAFVRFIGELTPKTIEQIDAHLSEYGDRIEARDRVRAVINRYRAESRNSTT